MNQVLCNALILVVGHIKMVRLIFATYVPTMVIK